MSTPLSLDEEPEPLSLFDGDEVPRQLILKLNPDSPYAMMYWSDLYGKVVEGFKVVGICDILKPGVEYMYREVTLQRI